MDKYTRGLAPGLLMLCSRRTECARLVCVWTQLASSCAVEEAWYTHRRSCKLSESEGVCERPR